MIRAKSIFVVAIATLMVFSLLGSITYAFDWGGFWSGLRNRMNNLLSGGGFGGHSGGGFGGHSGGGFGGHGRKFNDWRNNLRNIGDWRNNLRNLPSNQPFRPPTPPTPPVPPTPPLSSDIELEAYCDKYGCTGGAEGVETTRTEGEVTESQMEQHQQIHQEILEETYDDVTQIADTIDAKPNEEGKLCDIHVDTETVINHRTGETTTETERWIKFYDQEAVIFGPEYLTTDDGDNYKKDLITHLDDPSLDIGESYWAYRYYSPKERESSGGGFPGRFPGRLKSSCYCTSWKEVNCGEGGCSQTEMLYTRSCSPSGCAAESMCISNPKCTIKCYTNSDCKDSDPCTADICHNPGTVESYCSNEYYCEGTNISCGCTSCVNCNEKDGWYNISTYNCCDGDRCATCHDQEYRDYYCLGHSCEYKVLNSRTWKSYCADVKISPTVMNVALGSKNVDISTIKILNKCNYTMNLTIKLIAKDYPLSIKWLNFKTGNSECESIENCKETEIIVGDYGESSTTLHLEKAERVGKYEFEVFIKDNVKGETYKTRVWLNVFSEAIGIDNLFLLLVLLTLSVFIIYKYDHKK